MIIRQISTGKTTFYAPGLGVIEQVVNIRNGKGITI
jgi:hypothetical protein